MAAASRSAHAAALVLVLCLCPIVVCSQLCPALKDVQQVSITAMTSAGYSVDGSGNYFCSDSAPASLQCSCSSSSICAAKADPWGRDIGMCTCCAQWVYVVLAVFCVLFGILMTIIAYGLCLRGKWWFDGFPPPITVQFPKRGAPTIAPAGASLPVHLFRGYRSQDFINVANSNPSSSVEGENQIPLEPVLPSRAAKRVPRSVALRAESRSPASGPLLAQSQPLLFRAPRSVPVTRLVEQHEPTRGMSSL